uniref:Structure-specific endonuclease subunit SLX4 n=1 Tax=Anopheles dirus TaxID=7168 RepID=A0A182NHH0_9DIPT
MSKRLKFSKLRLVKPIDSVDPPTGAVPAEPNNVVSKYFASEMKETSASQATFIETVSEVSVNNEEAFNEQHSCRSTALTNACLNDASKLPKLRKRTSEGNALISTFLSTPSSNPAVGDDDFEEPKAGASAQLVKRTKVQRTSNKPKKPADKRPKKQGDIRKVFRRYKNDHELLHKLLQEHSTPEQIDPEQLQMALAMSRSLADQEYSPDLVPIEEAEECEPPTSSSDASNERRIVGIRTTLEQFGFRCKNSYTDYDLNVIFGKAGTKNVKKIKHKRATNLQHRSREELTTFSESQAKKLFLSEACVEQQAPLPLECLESSYRSTLFWIAQTEQSSERLMEKYYVPELLEANPAPVGCLLKDWRSIPGRECTPEKVKDGMQKGKAKELPTVEETEKSARMSSPDLFDDCEQDEEGTNAVCDNSSGTSECVAPYIHCSGIETSNESVKFIEHSVSNVPAYDNTAEHIIAKRNQFLNNTEFLEENTVRSCNEERLKMNDQTSIDPVVVVIDNSSEDEDKHDSSEDEYTASKESPHSPQPLFDRSSENIFEDTDPNPIVSFEVYSSEEEKIPAATPAIQLGTMQANGEIKVIDHVLTNNTEKQVQCNEHEQNGSLHQNVPNLEIANASTIERRNFGSCAMQTLLASGKELSFHRLAVKARLSEATQDAVRLVETVDLSNSEEQHGVSENSNQMQDIEMSDEPLGYQCSQSRDTQDDDILYISDDEVNYSIRCELTRAYGSETAKEEMGSPLKEDANKTLPYYMPEPNTDRYQGNANNSVPVVSDNQSDTEMEILTISSNEIVDQPVTTNCNENTFAYLDNLVKEFNLPPLRTQPRTGCNSSSQSQVYEPIVEAIGCATVSEKRNTSDERANHQTPTEINMTDATADKQLRSQMMVDERNSTDAGNKAARISDLLSDYIKNYEEPKFYEKETETELITSHEPPAENVCSLATGPPGSRVLSRYKSCSQFESPKDRSSLKRIASDTNFFSSSTPKEKDLHLRNGKDNFQNKFEELKMVTEEITLAEYVIRTGNATETAPFYEDMSTPEIERELFKFGLKALKRSKAVRMLNHIFDEMHPYVVVMERKHEHLPLKTNSCSEVESSKNSNEHVQSPSSLVVLERPQKCPFKLDDNFINHFLPSKPRKKVAWCAVPLHISFFNLVSENESLQRQILRYDPIDLEYIYGVLKDAGLRYETNDLIAYLDKHCITFRTTATGVDRTTKAGKTRNDGRK